VEIDSFPAVIGRSTSCVVRIDDPLASREHASIEERQGRLVLVDPGSLNGTWIGADLVTERALAEGDEFRIGSTMIRIAAIREAPAPAASEPAIREPMPPAPAETEKLDRHRVRRLPLLYRAGPALFVLVAGGAIAYHLASRARPRRRPPPIPFSPSARRRRPSTSP